jgi:hypothetical protein
MAGDVPVLLFSGVGVSYYYYYYYYYLTAIGLTLGKVVFFEWVNYVEFEVDHLPRSSDI